MRQSSQDLEPKAEQELHIQRLICKNRPEQLRLRFALWSRAAVLLLVQQEFGIELPIRTMGEYLKRWGFTPKKPITRTYEQYPAIAERAKLEDAEIHSGDETAVVNTDVRGRGYRSKAQTPVADAVGGTRHKLSMIFTVLRLRFLRRKWLQKSKDEVLTRPGSEKRPRNGAPDQQVSELPDLTENLTAAEKDFAKEMADAGRRVLITPVGGQMPAIFFFDGRPCALRPAPIDPTPAP